MDAFMRAYMDLNAWVRVLLAVGWLFGFVSLLTFIINIPFTKWQEWEERKAMKAFTALKKRLKI
ncbi:MAG: hypothetical protein LBS60_08765 [Deltaproteobacteria bacterium]|jgi:hypothetical protein|nr:hypothetical protein [Deltaproteobacteria bacterium]